MVKCEQCGKEAGFKHLNPNLDIEKLCLECMNNRAEKHQKSGLPSPFDYATKIS